MTAIASTLIGPCRLYRGALNEHGYGVPCLGAVRIDARGENKGRRQVLLHRWVVEQVEGRPLEPGEVVMHLCDTPACYRYSHLRRATQRENIVDGYTKGRIKPPPRPPHKSDEVCAHGHTEVVRNANGKRHCRRCGREREQRRRTGR